MSDNYKIIYDEELYGPGLLIYKELNNKCTFFLKIFTDSMHEFETYYIISKDWIKDYRNTNFSEIIVPIKENDSIYNAISNLYKNLNGSIISNIDTYNYGQSYMNLKKSNDTYILSINKDQYNGKRVDLNYTKISIGDNITGKQWKIINGFYNDLSKVLTDKNSKIIPKILKLIK